MKLTEKYNLCDLCSKIVEKEKINSITQVLDRDTGKSYLVKDIELSRISLLFHYDKAGDLLKKYIDILHFCPECSDFESSELSRTKTILLCLDYLDLSEIFQDVSDFYFNKNPIYASLKNALVSKVMAIVIDNSLDKKLSFAKAKNNKLAEVYFSGINILIKESLSEERNETESKGAEKNE